MARNIDGGWYDAIAKISGIINKETTTEDVRLVVRGKWKMVHPLQLDDGGALMCSVCKTGSFDVTTDYVYCPWCGADMREVEE